LTDAALLPTATNIALAIACLAMTWALVLVARRHPRSAFARAQLPATIFLGAAAATCLVEAVTSSHPNADLSAVLRAITALAGIITAIQVMSAASKTPDESATATNGVPAAAAPAAAAAAAAVEASEEPGANEARDSRTSVTDIVNGASAPAPEAGFLGLVSHELRTPLTAMQLLLDRLGDAGEELAPRQRSIVDRLNATAARLTDLVDSILYYARLRNGRLVASVEPFDLGTLALDVTEELRPQAQRKSLDLEAKTTRDRISIESDPKLIRLVLLNIVSNALKFTERGKVAIAVSAEGDTRVVRVTDSGAGIAADEQKRIFEPFQNVEPTKHKHLPGVGLGLSLARQIVDSLGGHISVRSELGKGSTFEVSLPAVATSATSRAAQPGVA
jgi:signal transduction histidine kinase